DPPRRRGRRAALRPRRTLKPSSCGVLGPCAGPVIMVRPVPVPPGRVAPSRTLPLGRAPRARGGLVMSRRNLVRLMMIGVAASALGTYAHAQTPEQTSAGKTPPYPRIDLSPWYEVDASWPHKPAEFAWKAMSGIAVDARD